MEKKQEKTYEKTTLSVIYYRLIIFILGVFFSYPLISAIVLMLVAVTTVRGAPTHSVNSASSHLSTKALCHCQIVKSHNVSFPNAFFNNAVAPLDIFFERTQNLMAQRSSLDTSIFLYIQRHTVGRYTSVLCLMLAFFSSSRQLLYTSAPTFWCILSAEKIVFSISPRAQSFAVEVC